MVMRWFRKRKRKEIGKRQGENKMKIGHSQVNNSVILRISYVYVTYILRMSYVIDSGKTASMKGEKGKRKTEKWKVRGGGGGGRLPLWRSSGLWFRGFCRLDL